MNREKVEDCFYQLLRQTMKIWLELKAQTVKQHFSSRLFDLFQHQKVSFIT